MASILSTERCETKSVSLAFRRRLLFGLFMGWGATVVSSFTSIIKMSLLFRYLPSDVLGIWFLMIGAQATLGLLDFGFSKTLERRLAFARGKCGSNPDVLLDAAAQQHIRDLFATARKVYNVLCIVVFFILLGGGYIYFNRVKMPEGLFETFCIAWLIMCLGYAANMWGWYIQSAMNGLGDIGFSNAFGTMVSLLSLILIWIALITGYGLIALSVIWGLQGVLERIIGWLIIRKRNKWINDRQGKWNSEAFKSMLSPSIKWWTALVGTFLTTDITRYVIGASRGADRVPDFVATWGLLIVVSGFSAAVVSVSMPLLSQMWSAGDTIRIQRYVFKLSRIGLILVVGLVVGIGVFANEFFELWLGHGHFIGYTSYILMAINVVLCCHHGMLNIPCLAAEKMGFYKYLLLGGIFNLALTPWLTSRYGIEGACLAMLLSFLLTVHWIIPLMFIRLFHVNIWDYLIRVIFPACVVGLFVFFVTTAIKPFAIPCMSHMITFLRSIRR